MAVRRRSSYGFDIAGSNLGLRPETKISRSALSKLFPEINFEVPAAEEVEKPKETTSEATPTGTGVMAFADEDTIPASELEKYKINNLLGYSAPFDVQGSAYGPQARGRRLGYSGGAGVQPAEGATSDPAQSASSLAFPTYEMPEIDLSPYENALSESQNIISGLSQQLSDIMALFESEPEDEQQPIEEPKTTIQEPKTTKTTSTTVPAVTPTAPIVTPTATVPEPTQPLRTQIKESAATQGKPTTLGKTGVTNLISQGADINKIEQQARAAGVKLGQKAQTAVDRAQVQQIAAAPINVQKQVQQIAQATESGKITKAAVNALVQSGTSAAQIERAAKTQGIDIGKQAQELINKAQNKKKTR